MSANLSRINEFNMKRSTLAESIEQNDGGRQQHLGRYGLGDLHDRSKPTKLS